MGSTFLAESVALLERTPAALDALLRGLPDPWIRADEGIETWSVYAVVGHLIHAENADWMPRVHILLEHGTNRAFDPFDREEMLRWDQDRPLSGLLDEFAVRRAESLRSLFELKLTPEHLARKGRHPDLGDVTLRQLIATWTAHDLGHIAQISRVMAKRYQTEVGPWVRHLSLLRPPV